MPGVEEEELAPEEEELAPPEELAPEEKELAPGAKGATIGRTDLVEIQSWSPVNVRWT